MRRRKTLKMVSIVLWSFRVIEAHSKEPGEWKTVTGFRVSFLSRFFPGKI